MKGNGSGTEIKIHPKPTTTKEKLTVSLERTKGQYIFLKVVKTLRIEPLKEEDAPTRWITIGIDGLVYDLVEVLEKAFKEIEECAKHGETGA